MQTIILASSSPRREDLLKQIKIPFKIVPSNVEENINELKGTPSAKAQQLAYLKANDVANSLEEGLVLGADTIVVLGNEILGKPKDNEHAYEMLKKLSGKEHQVITGLALIDIYYNIKLVDHEITTVRFRELTPEMIKAYVESGEPNGKAGSYAIQGIGSIFVEEIRGCYPNVVGLPLTRLTKMLESIGSNVL